MKSNIFSPLIKFATFFFLPIILSLVSPAQSSFEIKQNDFTYDIILPCENKSVITIGKDISDPHHIIISKYDSSYSLVWKNGYYIDSVNTFLNQPIPHFRGALVDTVSSQPGYVFYGLKDYSNIVLTEQYSFIMKTDTAGNYLWSRQINLLAVVRDGIITSDGNYVFANTLSVLKVSSNSGNILWMKSANSPNNNLIRTVSVCELPGGNIIHTGHALLTGLIGDFQISKMDANGNLFWSKAIGVWDSLYQRAMRIKILSDGNLILAGSTHSGSGSDYFLAKLDTNANIIWAKTYGIPGNGDECYFVEQTDDGGFFLGGWTTRYNPNQSISYIRSFVIKTDSSGVVQWNNMYPGLYGQSQLGWLAKANDNGLILTYGYFVKTDYLGKSCSAIDTIVTEMPWSGNDSLFGTVPLSPLPSDSTTLIVAATSDSVIDICNLLGSSEIISEEEQITAYPNPAENNITISVRHFENSVLILHDLSGREILRKEFARQTTMPVKHLSPGMYIYSVTGSNGKTENGKMVKQ